MANKRYTFVAKTDEETTCWYCGKTNLKGTVVLKDNEIDDYVFFGTTCAAYALAGPGRTMSVYRSHKMIDELEQERKIFDECAQNVIEAIRDRGIGPRAYLGGKFNRIEKGILYYSNGTYTKEIAFKPLMAEWRRSVSKRVEIEKNNDIEYSVEWSLSGG
jgi:hypothetical protein